MFVQAAASWSFPPPTSLTFLFDGRTLTDGTEIRSHAYEAGDTRLIRAPLRLTLHEIASLSAAPLNPCVQRVEGMLGRGGGRKKSNNEEIVPLKRSQVMPSGKSSALQIICGRGRGGKFAKALVCIGGLMHSSSAYLSTKHTSMKKRSIQGAGKKCI